MPRHLLGLCAGLLAIGLALAGPARGGDAGNSGDLLIAVAGPSDGREAARTRETLAGATAEAARLADDGVIEGRRLTVISADDGCDAERARKTAEELSAKGVALVLGHPCERAAAAAAKVYGEKGILFIATSARHSALTDQRAGSTIFRLAGRDDRQGAAAGEMLARAYPDQTIAIIHDRSNYARSIFEGAAKTFKARTGKVPISAAIIGGDMEYRATVAKVKDASAALFAGFPIEAGFVLSSLRQAQSKADFIGTETLATDEFATTFGKSAVGLRILAAPQAEASAAGTGLGEAERASVALQIFAAAVREAGSSGSARIAEIIGQSQFQTTIGPVKFAGNGDGTVTDFAILEWQGSGWTTVGATPAVPAARNVRAKETARK